MSIKEQQPLLLPLSPTTATGTASSSQTFGNIIVSIIGTGILGLPFAFKIAGWLIGSLGVIIAGLTTFYCMTLLVECKNTLQSDEYPSQVVVKTYGDLGFQAFGRKGKYATEILIVISQCGGAVAYVVFIAQNLSSLLQVYNPHTFSSIILLLIPIQIALSWIRSLSALSPFSVFADVCNVLAMAIVVKDDLQVFDGVSNAKAVTSIRELPFSAGVAVFCFDSLAMTLALEGSMKDRSKFRCVLGQAFFGIVMVYLCFGILGYLAYGDDTRDIVTLNLPNDWSAIVVKIGLCVALTFTFPILMHPVHEIVEEKLNKSEWFYFGGAKTQKYGLYVSRAILPIMLPVVALWVPGFGVFVSMVGSTVSASLSFVLPAAIHLILMASSLGFCRRSLDVTILILGLAFAVYGTYNSVLGNGQK